MTIKPLLQLLLFVLLSATTTYAQQWPGLTLIASSQKDSLILVDTNGVKVKGIKCTGGNNVYSSYMQKGGFFYRACKPVVAGMMGGGMHGRIQKYDWNGALVWDYTNASTTSNLHHDFCPMPNGNVLVICYEVKPAGTVTAAGGTFANEAWFEKIIELQPTGLNTQNIVWEWHFFDHICQSTDAAKPNFVSSIVNNPQLFDIAKFLSKDQIHMNGIDFDSTNNQIVFSSHFLNETFVIDHSTSTTEAASHAGGASTKGGDFLYRYGKPINYGAAGGNAIDVLHDAHIVKHGPLKGMIGFFHNKGVSGTQSSADYVTLPRVGTSFTVTAGSAFTPTTFSKRFIPPGLYTSNMGSVEEYPNGNLLYCAALSGTIKETDSNNNVLWTYTTGQSAQAHRYTECEISGTKPNTPIITLTGSELSVPSIAGYKYQWISNGAIVSTTNTFTPSQFGFYTVVLKDSFGCASDKVPYGYYPAAITNTNLLPCNIYPNPAKEYITIEIELTTSNNVFVSLTSIDGRLVKQCPFTKRLDVQNIPTGNYILKIANASKIFAEQKITIAK